MTERKRPDPLAMIAKIAEEEERLSTTNFLAPIIAGGRVRVRVSGIIYEMQVSTRESGWRILRMTKPGHAEVVEPAPLSLISKYLELFPRVRLVLLDEIDKQWWALSSSTSDTRIQLTGPVPVQLLSGGTIFDTINCRFDGSTFWFESVDRRRDPKVASTLRTSLETEVKPDDIRVAGMVPQERVAYRMLWLHRHPNEPVPAPPDDRTRIRDALRHAGGTLQSFWFADASRESATVQFTADGQTHVVRVDPTNLSIQSAGICLSGRDGDFDLTSIVGVFRESGRVLRYDDDD